VRRIPTTRSATPPPSWTPGLLQASFDTPQILRVSGVRGLNYWINGFFDLQPTMYNGKPVWRKRDDARKWLLCYPSMKWCVCDSSHKDSGCERYHMRHLESDAALPMGTKSWAVVTQDITEPQSVTVEAPLYPFAYGAEVSRANPMMRANGSAARAIAPSTTSPGSLLRCAAADSTCPLGMTLSPAVACRRITSPARTVSLGREASPAR
jgi:hypothetical protein